jgi:hypothetical protein
MCSFLLLHLLLTLHFINFFLPSLFFSSSISFFNQPIKIIAPSTIFDVHFWEADSETRSISSVNSTNNVTASVCCQVNYIFAVAGKVVRMLKFGRFHPLSVMVLAVFYLFPKIFGNTLLTKGMISVGSNFGVSLFSM